MKAEFYWIPENKCRTHFYATGPADGTWNIHEALKFKTEEECAKWCDDQRISGAWVPTQHGFAVKTHVTNVVSSTKQKGPNP